MLSGKDLKIRRIMLDIKATDVAKVLGVHRSYISILESGKQNIPTHIRKQWEDFLHNEDLKNKITY